jgi:hypothetical protein
MNHNTEQRVLMTHCGRCGSRVLTDLLKQCPAVHWAGEIYERVFRQWERDGGTVLCRHREFVPWSMPGGITDQATMPPADPTEPLVAALQEANSQIFGFEVKPFHWRLFGLDAKAFLEVMYPIGFDRQVVLWRKNTLRKIVSSLLARRTGIYHLQRGQGQELLQVEVPVESLLLDRDEGSLLDFLQGFDTDLGLLSDLLSEQDSLMLTYEEDVEQDPRSGLLKLCDFLRIEAPPRLEVRYARTTPHPLRQVIGNFDEVAVALAGTRFEWMLEG